MAHSNNTDGLYHPQTYSFLSPETFETLVEGYINQLHVRKRNKALITQQLANDCLMVLTNPENTAIFNPKFRWWVRKHFVFTVVGELRILLDKKNGKPVCVREQLYDKVCYFHHIIGHGGRDKTFAAITKSYSKVPAELVSLFTKNCQTCLGVRKYSKNKRPILNENEYPHHHHHQQQQQQQQQQQAQLTCDTSSYSSSSSASSSATSQYHSQQQYGMITKPETGTITPISPIMHSVNSGFLGSTSTQQQLDSSYTQSQLTQFQYQQLQQMHNAMNAQHMGMTLDLSEMSLGNGHVSGLGSLSGLGHINTTGHYNLHGAIPDLNSTCSTPTALPKMDLPLIQPYDPNMAGALLPLGHLTQHQNTLESSSEQYDEEQIDAIGTRYSPLLDHHYHAHAYQQHHFQNNEYTTTSYTMNDHQQQQLQSTYSAAMSLTSMPLIQQHNQHSYEQQQQQRQGYQQPESSPMLTQNQMIQKQIQQEQQRLHQQQQQLSVSTSFASLPASGSSASLSSPPPSAAPSLSCSITTPTTSMSPTPLLVSAAHSNALVSRLLHPAHALSSLLDHEQKSHLSTVAELVSASHDL